MSINYEKYLYSTGTHYISNSGGDSKGGISGDKAGDQNGKEWQLRSWYNRPWTHVLRHPDPRVRRLIAELGIEGALNDLIGYDQGQRTTFWQQLKVSGCRPANIKVACEEDCSAGVASIIKAVGFLLGIAALQAVNSSNNSRSTLGPLKNAGFTAYTASKYIKGYTYLLPGDVLLYENHHVAINVTRGKNAEGEVADHVDTGNIDPDDLRYGDEGAAVKDLQTRLIALGISVGPDGADGDFGPNTEKAVKQFQASKGLPQTGVYDAATRKAMIGEDSGSSSTPATGKRVVISGCKECNIRTGPGTQYGSVGTAMSGDTFAPLENPDDWVPILYFGNICWVSPKYAKLG